MKRALLVFCLAATVPAQKPSFEVASVKRNADRILTVTGVQPEAGGRITAKAATLKQLVVSAYQVKEREIFGGPPWMDSERYDIEAKAASDIGLDAGLRQMLQELLSDRFRLRVHPELREMPVYTLTIAKGGAKLKKLDEECKPGPNGLCGGYVTRIGVITGQRASMRQLADALSAIMDRPVIDKTGLEGVFNDLKLNWVPDETQFNTWGVGAYKRLVSDPSGPSLFTAIQEQLGLKLDSAKGSVEVLIVDAAEKPAEN
jgi:uncharacterized protein (TIGR03435 family)